MRGARAVGRSLTWLTGLAVASMGPALLAQQPAGGSASDLVGSWMPTSVERLATGGGEPVSVPNPRGLLVFDAAGHVLEIVTRGDRAPYASFQPTPAEAQIAVTNFGGAWGTYEVDEAAHRLTYRVQGGVDQGLMGGEDRRSYAFRDDRLVVTSTRPHPGAPAGVRVEWQRLPELETLSPSHRRLVGFWQHVVERRLDANDAVLSESRRAPSLIVYTPTGHVGVHFPPLGRTGFAAALPTDEEALAAIRGYVGYFGVYSLHPGAVFHHRLATLGSAQGDTLRRFFEIVGSEVHLRFPLGRFQGQDSRTTVTLRRLSGEADMMPR